MAKKFNSKNKGVKKNYLFDDIIKVLMWDEEAKDGQAVLLPIKHFAHLIHEYLNDRN